MEEEDDDDDDDDPLCLAQTILEIDYQTILDDGDDVDEFCTFKDTLQGGLPKRVIIVLLCVLVDWGQPFCPL